MKPWSAEEDRVLVGFYTDRLPVRVIAGRLSRSRNSIIGRASRLGLQHANAGWRGPRRLRPAHMKPAGKQTRDWLAEGADDGPVMQAADIENVGAELGVAWRSEFDAEHR